MRVIKIISLLILLALSTNVYSDEFDEYSLTISPFHLVIPVYEFLPVLPVLPE